MNAAGRMKLFHVLNRIFIIRLVEKEKVIRPEAIPDDLQVYREGGMTVESAAEIYRNQIAEYNSKALERKYGWEKVGNMERAAGKNAVSFQEYMKNAAAGETEEKGTGAKDMTVFPEGKDVVMAHPPIARTNYSVDMNKPREEMTLDEYKQYICNRVSSLPVSDSMRACSSGVLIFKEEAFESMKDNPAYENQVMDMLREGFSAELPSDGANVGYQVIGKSAEECYGAAIPVKNYGWMQGLQSGLSSSELLTSSGLLVSGLLNAGISGLGLTSANLLSSGLWPYGISGLGLSSSGLLTSGLLSSGISGLGLSPSALLSSGLSASALSALKGQAENGNGARNYSANRANMVNAYKNTARNRQDYLNGKSSNINWI